MPISLNRRVSIRKPQSTCLLIVALLIVVVASHYTYESMMEFEEANSVLFCGNVTVTKFMFEGEEHKVQILSGGRLMMLMDRTNIILADANTRELSYNGQKIQRVTTIIQWPLISYHIVSFSIGQLIVNSTASSVRCYNCGTFMHALHNLIS